MPIPLNTITLVRDCVEDAPRILQVEKVSWQTERKTVASNKGLETTDATTVFVFGSDPGIRRGDFLVNKESVESTYSNIRGKSLRKALETDGAVCVKSVIYNQGFGGRTGHLEVTCE